MAQLREIRLHQHMCGRIYVDIVISLVRHIEIATPTSYRMLVVNDRIVLRFILVIAAAGDTRLRPF